MSLSRAQGFVRKSGVGAIVLTSKDANFLYVTEKQVFDAVLILPGRGKPVLFVSPLEKPTDPRFIYNSLKDFDKGFPALLEKAGVVGINESLLPVSLYKKIRKAAKVKDVYQGLERMRMQKSAKEIVTIQKACDAGCMILQEAIAGLKRRRFARESDIRRFLKERTAHEGCELAFEPIVASGKAGATPHYYDDQKLGKGFLILDFGVRVDGYCSDITRTVYLGVPSDEERRAYAAVLSCQEKSIAFVEEHWKGGMRTGMTGKTGLAANVMTGKGLTGKDVYEFACNALGKDAKFFTHGLGHGLGLRVHELPSLGKIGADPLDEGMAFTIEPGVYPGKFGIRIEDDLVLDKEVRVLTKSLPKGLLCIS